MFYIFAAAAIMATLFAAAADADARFADMHAAADLFFCCHDCYACCRAVFIFRAAFRLLDCRFFAAAAFATFHAATRRFASIAALFDTAAFRCRIASILRCGNNYAAC